jgi:hypothetical protein
LAPEERPELDATAVSLSLDALGPSVGVHEGAELGTAGSRLLGELLGPEEAVASETGDEGDDVGWRVLGCTSVEGSSVNEPAEVGAFTGDTVKGATVEG